MRRRDRERVVRRFGAGWSIARLARHYRTDGATIEDALRRTPLVQTRRTHGPG